jgi:hypothetical protein
MQHLRHSTMWTLSLSILTRWQLLVDGHLEIYRITTSEGISSQIVQLFKLISSISEPTTIYMTLISSKHYDLQPFCLADYFSMTSSNNVSLTCTNKSISEIIEVTGKCHVWGPNVLSKEVKMRMNNSSQMIMIHRLASSVIAAAFQQQHNVSGHRVSCIGGYITPSYQSMQMMLGGKSEYNHTGLLSFTGKALGLHDLFLDSMKSPMRNYSVIHWRRGDQVTSRWRCEGRLNKRDISVNCDSIQVFLDTIQVTLSGYPSTSGHAIYIATNEENATSLSLLRAHGYLTIQDFKHSFQHAVEYAIVDYLMLTRAMYIFGAGMTSLHTLIKALRHTHHRQGFPWIQLHGANNNMTWLLPD